jgi:hypothetical protein
MAVLTGTKPDRSLILVLGPLKVEVVHLTSVNTGDTYESKLANPSFAVVLPITAEDAAGDLGPTASITAGDKTVTLTGTYLAGAQTVLLLVFGDSLV